MPGSIGSDQPPKATSATNNLYSETNMPQFNMNEDIVISGISGRFPMAGNMKQFEENMLSQRDVFQPKEMRWGPTPDVPDNMPLLDNSDKLDCDFFLSNPRFSDCTDSFTRLVLSATYEAILDAGESFDTIWGTRTAVITAHSGVETPSGAFNLDPYIFQVNTASFIPNRTSYLYNLSGTSFTVNGYTTSSMAALDQACMEMRMGYADQAIVTGHCMALEPFQTVAGKIIGMGSPDGRCRSFDTNASGFGRGEAAVVFLLQKRSVAKRVYATIMQVKGMTKGFSPDGLMDPSMDSQATLMREVYEEVGVDPKKVSYVEALGTGVPKYDAAEANAIANVFCLGKKEPVLMGATASHIGCAESASGMASIAKCILAMESGKLPPNVLYTSPNKDVPALANGQLKVLDKVTPCKLDVVGVNSYSFGGADYHCCLKAHPEEKRAPHPASQLLRLFTYSARTAEGVKKGLEEGRRLSTNVEWQALLENAANTNTEKMPFRGYTILNHKTKVLERVGKQLAPEKPSVWFIFCGVGSQWPRMARDMFQLDIFRTTMQRCSDALKRYGLDLYDIFLNGDDKAFDTPTMTFLGITSVQICLVNLLRSMGVEPDGIVGHSAGEIAAGYADGCLTVEEAMLNSYWRGHSFTYVDFPKGAMAAIGSTWEEAQATVPEGVVCACHNSVNSVTISGRPEPLKKYVAELQAKDVFARAVKSNDVAFHSPDTKVLPPIIHRELAGMVQRRKRSHRWISSSVPEERWGEEDAQYSDVQYYTNNLTSPVLFYEATTKIPKNAVIIEIGPHGPLQSILKNTVGIEATVVTLMKRAHEDNVENFYSSLGTAYSGGCNVKPLGMFPPVQFPVPRGTPMVSNIATTIWDHSKSFSIYSNAYLSWDGFFKAYKFDLSKEEFEYLEDHKVAGTCLFPAAGLFVLAWHAKARSLAKEPDDVAVMLTDVKIHAATAMPPNGEVSFMVRLKAQTGEFEIWESDNMVGSGKVHSQEDPDCPQISVPEFTETELDEEEINVLDQMETYKTTLVKGFDYGLAFQKLLRSSVSGKLHEIEWDGHWISFIDGALVASGLGVSSVGFSLPVGISKLSIDPKAHPPPPTSDDEAEILDLFVDPELGLAVTGGLKFQGMEVERTEASSAHDHFMAGELLFLPFDKDMSKGLAPSLLRYASDCLEYATGGLQKALDNGMVTNTEIITDILKKSQIKGEADGQLAKYAPSKRTSIAQLLLSKYSDLTNGMTPANVDVKTDQISRIMFDTDAVTGLIDILQDDAHLFKMNVVELNASDSEIYKDGLAQLAFSFRLNITWYGLDPKESSDSTKSQCQKSLKWDFNQTIPEDLAQKVDTVIARNVLHKQKDIKESLKIMMSMMLPLTGKMMIIEPTMNFALAAATEGLDTGACPVFTDKRDVGPYLTEKSWLQMFKELGLEVMCNFTDKIMNNVFLVKIPNIPSADTVTHFVDASDPEGSWLEEAQEKIREVLDSPDEKSRLWFYADNFVNGLHGFIQTLAWECIDKNYRVRAVTVGNLKNNKTPPKIAPGSPEFQTLQRIDFRKMDWRDGSWGALSQIHRDPYKAKLRALSKRPFLIPGKPGDLNTLRFHSVLYSHEDKEESDHKQWASVYYSALNYTDAMVANGKLPAKIMRDRDCPEETAIGLEFVGRDHVTGKRIMGVASQRAIGPEIDLRHAVYCDIPDDMSMQDAATIFVAYGVSLYSILIKAGGSKGDRILIHSATGAVGQASVRIALHHGLEVFVTVGSEEKKNRFKKMFPEVPDSHISSSHSVEFEMQFLQVTQGEGVDIILNSLDNDKLTENFSLLKNGGCFLELGRKNVINDSNLEMTIFDKNIDFAGVDFINIVSDPYSKDTVDAMVKLMQDGIKQGYIKPLESTVYGYENVIDAFQLMNTGQHKGKVLIQFRQEEKERLVLPSRLAIPASMRLMFDRSKVYISVGGTGGLGLEISEFLVERGAKKIMLTSRSGVTNAYQNYKVQRWGRMGVQVEVLAGSCATMEGAREVIKEALKIGPVGGIINFAGLIRDGEFMSQTTENFREVMRPKLVSVINLDKVTREMCGDTVDWFIAISSQTGGRGNEDQTNYAFANSSMERVVQRRRIAGYRGCTSIQYGGIGDTGILAKVTDNETVMNNSKLQRIVSCRDAFEYSLLVNRDVVTSGVPAGETEEGSTGASKLTTAIFKIFGVKDISTVDPDMTLTEIGMDSIQSVQIKRLLDVSGKIQMNNKDIGSLTLRSITEMENA